MLKLKLANLDDILMRNVVIYIDLTSYTLATQWQSLDLALIWDLTEKLKTFLSICCNGVVRFNMAFGTCAVWCQEEDYEISVWVQLHDTSWTYQDVQGLAVELSVEEYKENITKYISWCLTY